MWGQQGWFYLIMDVELDQKGKKNSARHGALFFSSVMPCDQLIHADASAIGTRELHT
jgi:hypothetical protein